MIVRRKRPKDGYWRGTDVYKRQVYVIPNGITGLLEDAWGGRVKAGGSAPGALQRALDASAGSVRNLLRKNRNA